MEDEARKRQWMEENTFYCKKTRADLSPEACAANRKAPGPGAMDNRPYPCISCTAWRELCAQVERRRAEKKEEDVGKKKMAICKRCGNEKPHHGRGLCGTCYLWAASHGKLDDYPLGGVEREERIPVEEPEGQPEREAAEKPEAAAGRESGGEVKAAASAQDAPEKITPASEATRAIIAGQPGGPYRAIAAGSPEGQDEIMPEMCIFSEVCASCPPGVRPKGCPAEEGLIMCSLYYAGGGNTPAAGTGKIELDLGLVEGLEAYLTRAARNEMRHSIEHQALYILKLVMEADIKQIKQAYGRSPLTEYLGLRI